MEVVRAIRDTLLNYVDAVELQLAGGGGPKAAAAPATAPGVKTSSTTPSPGGPRPSQSSSTQERRPMPYRWMRKPALLGLGLTATLAAGLAGCGDQTADKDNAVVVPDPNAVVNTKSTSTSGAGKSAPSSGGTESSAPKGGASGSAATVTAEGW